MLNENHDLNPKKSYCTAPFHCTCNHSYRPIARSALQLLLSPQTQDETLPPSTISAVLMRRVYNSRYRSRYITAYHYSTIQYITAYHYSTIQCIPLQYITAYHYSTSLHTTTIHHCIPLQYTTAYHYSTSPYTTTVHHCIPLQYTTAYHYSTSLHTTTVHHCIPLQYTSVHCMIC